MNKVAVIGLGYVGLPLASLCASKGYQTVGLDSNEKVISMLQAGKCHIRDETVENFFSEAVASRNLFPTTDINALAECNIYLICVPTPVDENRDPDLRPLQSAVETVSKFINKGDLIVVESTIFPGTCEQIVLPLMEKVSGLDGHKDFYLAHCPERVNPGDLFWHSGNIPRVVGAINREGVEIAAKFYAAILGGEVFAVEDIKQTLKPKFSIEGDTVKVAQVPLGSVTMMRSIRDAEAVKAMENTVRDVNIAFVNELAKISDVLDLDVVDIIDGMGTKPFGKGPFYPGAGVGGHCIAVDPEWLNAASKKAGYIPEIINLARDTNNGMPEYTVSILQDLLNECGLPLKGTAIAVLGVSYKRNVDDPRESPFYAIRDLLQAKGARLYVYDSWYENENTVETLESALSESKAVLIVTEHSDIVDQLKSYNFDNSAIEVIVDGRNCLGAEVIDKWRVLYRGIGRRGASDNRQKK
jgi:UDP-N-acetyl-D-glucosamine dehydrogenase